MTVERIADERARYVQLVTEHSAGRRSAADLPVLRDARCRGGATEGSA
jgi:hypothetical protein